MKSKYLIPLLSSALLWSCNKEQTDSTNPSPSNPSIDLYSFKGIDVKVSFAQALAKAVANPAIRQLLAEKASLQFDKDYDVLYHQIKNDKINGRRLDEYIKEVSSESDYDLFSRTPLLTVFIPHSQQVATKLTNASPVTPWIAVRDHNDKLVAYNSTGESKELNADVLPDFPVMVVKENERVVYENSVKKESQKGRFLFESEGNRYFFAHDEFDGTAARDTIKLSQARFAAGGIDPTVQTAYNNSLTCNTCPQRDWVYYGINPPSGAVQGTMNIKYAEAITEVVFTNANVYSTIGGWDEGNYELYISIFFSGASTGVFTSVLKVISVSPNDMFSIDSNRRAYAVKNYYPSSPIVIAPWDMQAYGNRWAFKVEEYDPEVKKTASFTHNSTYGTNFKVDASGTVAKVFKVGTEFGTTSTTSNTNVYTYETTDANDILGGAILTWTDPLIKNQHPFRHWLYTYMSTINTGTTEIGVETTRISL